MYKFVHVHMCVVCYNKLVVNVLIRTIKMTSRSLWNFCSKYVTLLGFILLLWQNISLNQTPFFCYPGLLLLVWCTGHLPALQQTFSMKYLSPLTPNVTWFGNFLFCQKLIIDAEIFQYVKELLKYIISCNPYPAKDELITNFCYHVSHCQRGVYSFLKPKERLEIGQKER